MKDLDAEALCRQLAEQIRPHVTPATALVGIYTGGGMMIDSPRAGKSTSERAIFSGVSGYGRF